MNELLRTFEICEILLSLTFECMTFYFCLSHSTIFPLKKRGFKPLSFDKLKTKFTMKKFILFIIIIITILLKTSCTSSDIVQNNHTIKNSVNNNEDLVLLNGAIYTVNDEQPWAEALVIEDGIITFVGLNKDAQSYINDDTKVIDLEGSFVMPGIHDVHIHPLEAFNEAISVCELENGIAIEEQLSTIEKCAKSNRDQEWVTGWGYGIEDILNTTENPAILLDQVVADRPALMMEYTSHSMWVNSKALELAGFMADTPNPPGGIIVKDPKTGQPTGMLIDNAGNMVRELLYANPSQEMLDITYNGLLLALEELSKNGITSIADARVYWKRKHHEVWQRAASENQLTARVVLDLWAAPELGDEQIEILKSLYDNDPNSLLRASQIKMYSDGIVDVTTAAMKAPYDYSYEFTPDDRGINYFTQERITKFITDLAPVGFDFHIHAIGDRGIHEALNAIEKCTKN